MISNANVHYAPVLLLIEKMPYFQPNVSDHCSPVYQDCIQEHTAGGKIFRFHPYAFPAMSVPSLSDAPADYQGSETLSLCCHVQVSS